MTANVTFDFTPQDVMHAYRGLPYRHMGRDPETGLDCWGLPKDIYKRFLGVDLIDEANYEKRWFKKGFDFFLQRLSEQFSAVNRPGFLDMVLLKDRLGFANHVGVMLDRNRFIHANKAGVTISRISDGWRDRVVQFYRLSVLTKEASA